MVVMKTLSLVSMLCVLFTSFCFTDTYTADENTLLPTHIDHNNDDFYNVIIENNLFRPLGWYPPSRVVPYKLIATLTYPIEAKTSPTAILLETTDTEKTHYVTIGDKINDTVVVKIEPKQITLHQKGSTVLLHITANFLNTSGQQRRTPSPPSFIHSDPTRQKLFMPPYTAKVPDWVRNASFK